MALLEFKDVHGNVHWLEDSECKYNKIRALGYSDGEYGYFMFDTGREIKVDPDVYFDVWTKKDREICNCVLQK